MFQLTIIRSLHFVVDVRFLITMQFIKIVCKVKNILRSAGYLVRKQSYDCEKFSVVGGSDSRRKQAKLSAVTKYGIIHTAAAVSNN